MVLFVCMVHIGGMYGFTSCVVLFEWFYSGGKMVLFDNMWFFQFFRRITMRLSVNERAVRILTVMTFLV